MNYQSATPMPTTGATGGFPQTLSQQPNASYPLQQQQIPTAVQFQPNAQPLQQQQQQYYYQQQQIPQSTGQPQQPFQMPMQGQQFQQPQQFQQQQLQQQPQLLQPQQFQPQQPQQLQQTYGYQYPIQYPQQLTQQTVQQHQQPQTYQAHQAYQQMPQQQRQQPQQSSSIVPQPNTTERRYHIASFNCPERYMTPTMKVIPTSSSVLKKQLGNVPFGINMHPLADTDIPVIDGISHEIHRCKNCRAYINPYVIWTNQGHKWKCNFCGELNGISGVYYSSLDHITQLRKDVLQRSELCHGCVEYLAPTAYCSHPPMVPVYCFVVDASFVAVQTKLLDSAIASIKKFVEGYEGDSRTKFALMTYDTRVHYYSFRKRSSGAIIQPDLNASFLPLPADSFIVNMKESKETILNVLNKVPEMYAQSTNPGGAFGPAITCASQIVKRTGGKIMAFLANYPAIGEGRTDTERAMTPQARQHTVFAPCDTVLQGQKGVLFMSNSKSPEDFYKELALDLSRTQTCVDIFACTSTFTDIATLNCLTQITGGQLHYFPNFTAADAKQLDAEVTDTIVRQTGYEAVIRVRCSKGVRASHFYGNFFVRSADLLAIPSPDAAKGYSFDVDIEGLNDGQKVYLQSALLYTTNNSERRIRVSTLELQATNSLGDIFASMNSEAIVTMLAKQTMEDIASKSLAESRESLFKSVVNIAQSYLVYRGIAKSFGNTLQLPDNLQTLPLFMLALLKTPALAEADDLTFDDRTFSQAYLKMIPQCALISYIHPLMYDVTELASRLDTRVELQEPENIDDVSDDENDKKEVVIEGNVYPNDDESSYSDSESCTSDTTEEEQDSEKSTTEATINGENKAAAKDLPYTRQKLAPVTPQPERAQPLVVHKYAQDFPPVLPLSSSAVDKSKILLLDGANETVLYVGELANEELVVALFGVGYPEVDFAAQELPRLKTKENRYVRKLVARCATRQQACSCKPRFRLVSKLTTGQAANRGPLDFPFNRMVCDHRGKQPSYNEFILKVLMKLKEMNE